MTTKITTTTTTTTTTTSVINDYQDDEVFDNDDEIIDVGSHDICNGVIDSFVHIRRELFVFKGEVIK